MKTNKKITLRDYLMWIAEDETNIDADLIRNELMFDDSDKALLKFYEINKDVVLEEFNETYVDGDYRLGCTVSFYFEGNDGEYYDFEIPDVCGSFLHDNNMVPDDEPKPKPKKNLEEWAEELLEYYNCSASNQLKICICAEQMADFLEAFLNKE